MFIEQNDQSRKFAPQLRECAIGAFPSVILRSAFSAKRREPSELSLITGLVFRRSLYGEVRRWQCDDVNELRELRRNANLTQRDLAELLTIPVNTFRMWDSGLRRAPVHLVARAREALAARARQRQLLPLADLAIELGVHVRTLRAAARTGRLMTEFSVRSVFGRPIRSASRHAGQQFLARHYRCFSGQEICPAPLPTVPDDYDKRLREVRSRSGLSQDALARRIGAASKAVVYQWESRRRTPSPVLWQRVLELESQPAARWVNTAALRRTREPRP